MLKKDERRSYFLKGLTAFLTVAACIVFYFLFLRMGKISSFLGKVVSVLQPVIFGVVIAYLVNPVVNFFNGKCFIPFFKKRIKSSKTAHTAANAVSVSISMILFCAVIAGLIWLVIPQFITSVVGLAKVLPGQIDAFVSKIEKFLNRQITFKSVIVKAIEYEKNWFETDFADTANSLASSVASGVWDAVTFIKDFIIGVIFAVYILLSKRLFVNQTRKFFYAVFKEKTVNKFFSWFGKVHSIFSGFINGKLIDSLLIGILCFIGVSVLRMPYTVLVSVVIGVTNVIPVFGPWIGGIPCCLLIMLTNPLKGLYFGIFVILLQTLDGNILGPKILGSKTGINTFWVMFAIVVGGGMFGVIGMLIGVPTFAVLYYVITTLINRSLRKKGKSTNSADYYKSNGDIKGELPKEEETADA